MSLEVIVLLLVIAAFAIYAVLGGADFGAGIWDISRGSNAKGIDAKNRELIYHAIGPVWETNHVWLIFILVLLFGAFPPAFAAINSALFVPLLLALVGIVFRGAAYAFRSQMKSDPGKSRVWMKLFSFASIFAPLFLGASIGAIASGKLKFDSNGMFIGDHLSGWVNSLSIFTAVLTLGICCYTSAAFMIRESKNAGQPKLVEIWRRRAIWTGWLIGAMAVSGLALAYAQYPELWQGLVSRGWPFVLCSILTGLVSLWAIHQRHLNMAVAGASLTVAAVVFGWGFAQYPYLIPGHLTASESASPRVVLQIILLCTLVGAIFLLPAMWLLFKIFKSDTVTNTTVQ